LISSSSSEEEYEKIEKERLRDIKERDEFSERLKKRDQEKTRSIVNRAGKVFF
jgi:pre-mRNA-splicing factor ATP-dependent RNA helicase DHX16